MARKKKQFKLSGNMRHLIAQTNPKSPISEQYRTVRTNIQFASVDEEIRSLLVTSSAPGEGKSSTTANLAIVYAQQGKRVLLIDADLRKPTIHYTFRLDNLRGLSNVLVGEIPLEDAIHQSEVNNLDVMSCGPIPPNPAELLASRKMEKILAEAKLTYDIILFDTPPVLAVTDAQILAKIVDGSILVVRSGETEIEPAQKAKEAVAPAKAKLLGVVLNGREKKQSNYYYYYGNN